MKIVFTLLALLFFAAPVFAVPVPFPDYPVEQMPQGAISVRFLVEHRSDLNGKRVTVAGVVLPPQEGQKGVLLTDADHDPKKRDYQITVFFPDTNPAPCEPGETIEATGIVEAGPTWAAVRVE